MKKTGFKILTDRKQIEGAINASYSTFSPERLSQLTDDKILSTLFYTTGDNSNSLCYWLEAEKKCRELFGSIAGGSAYKFGLFQKKESGKWTTGSSLKPQEVTEEESVIPGKKIRDALVKGAQLIRESPLSSLSDYEKLDNDIKTVLGDQLYNWTWMYLRPSVWISLKTN